MNYREDDIIVLKKPNLFVIHKKVVYSSYRVCYELEMPHSGLQRDILAFYKLVLRKAQTQPPEVRKAIEDYAKSEFRKNVCFFRVLLTYRLIP